MITYCFQRCHSANIYCVTRDLSAPGCPKVVVAGRCALWSRGGGGGAAELRPSAAQQQLMSVIDFAGCGTVTVRRTSDSSTTTHSFLHHATKTQQQLNLETVGWPHQQRAHCEGHSLGGGSVRAVRGGWEEVTGGDETE